MLQNEKKISALFVDDEPELLSALQDYFEPIITVRSALTGANGLEILQEFKPDVIVSDQRMEGMTGVDFFEKSIALSPDSERVLMTGYGDVSSVIQGISRAKISYYITKPLDFQQLRMTVEQLGEAARLRRQNADLIRQLRALDSNFSDSSSLFDSDLSNAYERLQQVQRTREQMVRIAVHDLKAPLGNIDLILSELLQQNIDPADYQELVDIARHSVNIMRSLIDDMLTVATITQPEFNPPKDFLLLSPYLKRLAAGFQTAAARKNIELRIEVPDNLPAIYADPSQIQQLINNLLSNAIKYTPYGGAVFFSSHTDDNSIVIIVRDTGLGMTPNDMQNAFQEFQRLSARPTGGESSTGLGLFIVKKMLDLNGGSVNVASDGPNKGATFTIRLPKLAEQQ